MDVCDRQQSDWQNAPSKPAGCNPGKCIKGQKGNMCHHDRFVKHRNISIFRFNKAWKKISLRRCAPGAGRTRPGTRPRARRASGSVAHRASAQQYKICLFSQLFNRIVPFVFPVDTRAAGPLTAPPGLETKLACLMRGVAK